MRKRFVLRHTVLLFSLGLLFGLGCASSPPSRFYVLSSLEAGGRELKELRSGQDLTIVVGPITFPEYLDRTEIVTRSGNNKITFSAFDLWAGSLAEDFSRALAENLSALLPTANVVVHHGPRPSSVDYRIIVDVIRFDGPLGGDVSLIARWGIIKGKEKKVVFVRRSTIIEPSGTQGYEAMVAADSRALEKLSREIAESIKTLPKSS
jgi:hypothetical protein